MSGTIYEQVDQYLSANYQRNLQELERLLAIPSISALPEHRSDVRQAAQMLADKMQAIGLQDVAVMETGGHPAVYGAWQNSPGKPTALVYGHYDVQPVDPLHLWTTPPFTPNQRNGQLFARGASDDKGQLWMHLLATEAFLRVTGSLPVNLKFLFEGEEEIGSKNLPQFVKTHHNLLAADVIVISDTEMFAPGIPSICTGLRGLAMLELHTFGPKSDLHSGLYGGAVANPLHALASLIANLHDECGRVTVPGFYDEVQPLSPEEHATWATLPWDAAAFEQEIGSAATYGEPEYTPLERIWARPTLEVNGLWGGFQGQGSKTIIPAEAHAKLTCRLVPAQDPDRVLAAIKHHLEQHCPPGIRLQVDTQGGSPATLTPVESSYVQAASRALHQVFGKETVFTRMGGSIGVVPTLTNTLQAPLVLMGFGLPGSNVHAPNERLNLDNYQRGQRALVSYWLELENITP